MKTQAMKTRLRMRNGILLLKKNRVSTFVIDGALPAMKEKLAQPLFQMSSACRPASWDERCCRTDLV
jgi:hypothetical protein